MSHDINDSTLESARRRGISCGIGGHVVTGVAGAISRTLLTVTRLVCGCDSGSDFNGGIVGVGGIVQWRIVAKDGRIVEAMEVVGVEGSRV